MMKLNNLPIVLVILIFSFYLYQAEANLGRKKNPEITPGLYQGDMVVDKTNLERNGMRNPKSRWPNKTILYFMSSDYNETEIEQVENAVNKIAKESCLEFKRLPEYKAGVIKVLKDAGCSSYVGYDYSIEFNMSLVEDCFTETGGIIIHEFLHAVGFHHQHSTHNRDDHVEIFWENIHPQVWDNFEKCNDSIVSNFEQEYDFDSIMHYTKDAFSINGLDTIRPKRDGVTIGQREGLSEKDIKKINIMYKCNV